MYKTIVLDCQAKDADFSCEDCIVFRECSFSKKKITNALQLRF